MPLTTKVKVTATGIEYPFVRLVNPFSPNGQKYEYNDNGNLIQISTADATIVKS